MVLFPAKNNDAVEPMHVCQLCRAVSPELFQLKCNHLQCKSCIGNNGGYVQIIH